MSGGPVASALRGGAPESAARFPDEVIVALHEAGVTLGCLPVRVDGEDWQAALFYVVPPDAPCLTTPDPGGRQRLHGAPFTVALELELHEHAAATVIELGVEIRTPGAPLAGAVLFLTGHSSAHFDALSLLTAQADLPLFIGDEYCRLLASQRVPLGDGERHAFRSVLDEAVGRDAVIRLSGHYDPFTAFDDVLGQASVQGAAQGGAGGGKHGGGEQGGGDEGGDAPGSSARRYGPPPGPNGTAGR